VKGYAACRAQRKDSVEPPANMRQAWRMREIWQALAAPLGEPWSGRVRYAAAMELYSQGLLTHEVLEVYRMLSRLDHAEPALLLQDFGLPLPAHKD
jgi:hypothetical protein